MMTSVIKICEKIRLDRKSLAIFKCIILNCIKSQLIHTYRIEFSRCQDCDFVVTMIVHRIFQSRIEQSEIYSRIKQSSSRSILKQNRIEKSSILFYFTISLVSFVVSTIVSSAASSSQLIAIVFDHHSLSFVAFTSVVTRKRTRSIVSSVSNKKEKIVEKACVCIVSKK